MGSVFRAYENGYIADNEAEKHNTRDKTAYIVMFSCVVLLLMKQQILNIIGIGANLIV